MGHPIRVDILWHKNMLAVFGFLFYPVVCVVMPCSFGMGRGVSGGVSACAQCLYYARSEVCAKYCGYAEIVRRAAANVWI